MDNLKIPPFIFILIAAFCWGIIGLFTRLLSSLGLSVLQVSFIRSFFTFIELFIIILLTNRGLFKIEIKDLIYLALIGIVSITFFNFFYFETIELTTLSVAAILLYTAPCFVVILSVIFLKQKVTFRIVISLIISFIGCFLTTGFIGSDVKISFIGILTGVLSGFFYGLYSIFGTIVLKKYNTITVIFYAFLFSSLAMLPFSYPIKVINMIINNNQILLNSIEISIISTLIPYYFYSVGLSQMAAAKASIIAFAEPLTATLLGIIYFHEALSIQNAIGILLIFIALILINLKTSKEMKN